MKVLITGISGLIGRLVATQLHSEGHQVVGIDRRFWHAAPDGVEVHRVDIRKRGADAVFRSFRPQGVIHLATVTHFDERGQAADRINLQGTRAVFRNCARHDVKRAVFVGRHTYYGAAPDAPLFHREDEPPSSISGFPELADLVAADLYAGSALWRYPDLGTVVLRLCYSLGENRHGTLASFLKGPRVPLVLGFDPLIQFMHELDMANAICTALCSDTRGVYNVAGPPPLPMSVLIKESGRKKFWLPEPLFALAIQKMPSMRMSRGAVDHLKYPILIDDAPFREATAFDHRFHQEAIIDAFVQGQSQR